jgi:hypothetical protein
LAFSAIVAEISDNPTLNSPLSVSVERHRGTTGTFKVPVAGGRNPKKLSKSLVTAPRGVTTPVPLEYPFTATNSSLLIFYPERLHSRDGVPTIDDVERLHLVGK